MLSRRHVHVASRRCFAATIWLAALLFVPAALAQQPKFKRDCAASVFIESSVGIVTVTTRGVATVSASRNLQLCPGDEVVTGPNGRAAIRFEESRTVIRLNRNSKMRVRSTGKDDSGVGLVQGILYFLSSVRTHFTVETPYIVAGIDGTEALAGVDNDVELVAVREGLLGAYDRAVGAASRLPVPAGDAAYRSGSVAFDTAPIDELPPPFSELLITSDSAVDWAIYYPPVRFLESPAGRADAQINQAIELLRSGNYESAIAALDRVKSAAPAETASLRTIIAIARNRIDEAERWSAEALRAKPDFAPAHIAASYVRQAIGDLNGALDYAYEAARMAPDDAYVIARLAELQMIVGDRPAALRSAEWSISINPTSLALFVEGLARLAAWQYQQAEQLFSAAIDLDQQAPLPRLGLGLASIRQGKTADGAWQMELAVAHDPKRASFRNWLGRAYYDEGLDKKAADQFQIAKQDDPEDPTPYLFSALERYAANDPIGALDELQGADERGGARRVLRTQQGLGEDTATVGAALGRVFDVLGFDQLATNAGSAAVDSDPANPGAHRFLADAYRQRPETNIAQTSELLRSQLLSPPSSTPVQPELAEARLALLDTTGPSRVTFAEFAPLFDSDGFRFDLSGLYGTQKTWGDDAAITGLYRGFSLSVGQYHYETDGYRVNNDLTHDIVDATSTIALSPEFSLFAEYRYRETEGGDRHLEFNSVPFVDFDPNFRDMVTQEIARMGFHIQPSANSDVVGVYTWANLSDMISATFFGDLKNGNDSHSGQMQYIRNDGAVRSVVGGSYFHNDILFDLPIINMKTENISEYYNTYGYFDVDVADGLTVTLGGSLSRYWLSGGGPDILRFDPKLGVTLDLNDHTTLRAAYFSNVKQDFVSDQLIEPTTVAGFNQFYDAVNGSVLQQLGAGIDIEAGAGFWFGAEAVGQWWDVPLIGDPNEQDDSQLYRAYAYATLSDHFALSAEIVHEIWTSERETESDYWRTTSLPLTLSYFADTGLFGSIGVELVDHHYTDFSGEGMGDRFALVNAALGYRIPGNAGIFSIEVQNLFDQHIQFQNRAIRQDLTPIQRYAPERTILARGMVTF